MLKKTAFSSLSGLQTYSDIIQKMKIIRALKKHAETIAKLNFFVQSIHSEANPHIFKSYPDSEEIELFFEKALNDQKNYIFIAYLSDIPIGYLWAKIQELPETPFTYSKKRLYIHHIIVDENHRKRGAGTFLIDHIKKLSKEFGIQGILVDTWPFNHEATHFFQSQGFDIYNFRMLSR